LDLLLQVAQVVEWDLVQDLVLHVIQQWLVAVVLVPDIRMDLTVLVALVMMELYMSNISISNSVL
jgi:hypothetical protein